MVKNELKLMAFILVVFMMLTGCSSNKDIIREKIIEVEVPKLDVKLKEVEPVNVDSLLLIYIDTLATDSSYYEAETVTEKGDSVKVKFFLKDKETGKPAVEAEVKQKPVKYKKIDTTHVVVDKPGLDDYISYLIILAFIIAVIILIIKIKK